MPKSVIRPTTQRDAMVASQVRPSDVRDARVVAAMSAIPREAFVPTPFKGVAYVDEDIEIKPGRFLMEPRVLAKILAAAEIGPKDFVLEIGPATGYSTAVLADLADAVVALEEDQELAAMASATLEKLDVTNAAVINGPHRDGVARQAPFQIIFINGDKSGYQRHLINGIELDFFRSDKANGLNPLVQMFVFGIIHLALNKQALDSHIFQFPYT